MNNQGDLYTRDNFINLLERHFGTYDKNNEVIKFRRFNNKQIAEALTMGEAQFSKALNPQASKNPPPYKRYVDRVLMYADAKSYQVSRNYKNILFQVIALSIIIISFLSYNLWQSTHLSHNSDKNSRANQDLYIDPAPTLEEVLNYAGITNINRIKWEAVILNERIKAHKLPLTRKDSIQYIEAIKRSVQEAVVAERSNFSKLNFRLPSGVSIIDRVNKEFPTHRDSMFKCSDTDLLRIHIIDDLPDNATPFDMGIVQSMPFILDKEISYRDLADEIEEIVYQAQNLILFGIQ